MLQGYKGSMLKVGGKNGKSATVSNTKVGTPAAEFIDSRALTLYITRGQMTVPCALCLLPLL